MKRLHTSLLIVGLLSLASIASITVNFAGSAALHAEDIQGAYGSSAAVSLATDSPERMATMFLLLFMTFLAGLYLAVRHLRRRRTRFGGDDLRSDGPKIEKPPNLETGEAYLVTQGQNKALKVFIQELKKGNRGLCITRTHPDKLKESWDLEGAKVYWLANGLSKDKEAVNSLDTLFKRIGRFLETEEKGIILLDGVEYLFIQNSFTEVMKLLQNLKDVIPSRGAKLVIPIDLLTLVERQRALLTREFRQI